MFIFRMKIINIVDRLLYQDNNIYDNQTIIRPVG